MSKYDDITYRVESGVARIAVNRPEKLNAYRDQTADELRDAFRRAETDDTVNAVLLAGEGRAFGAGYDLSSIEPGETPDLARVLDTHFNPLIRAMRTSPLPIVAAVNGPCAGAAVGVALAADIVIGGRSTYFYEPFVGIGLVPDAGNTLFLPRILGRIQASGMMLLGDRIKADKALSFGLLWEVVEDDDLENFATTLCRRLADQDRQAIADTKRLIAKAVDDGINDQLDLERDLQGEAGRRPAMKSRIADFFSRKKA